MFTHQNAAYDMEKGLAYGDNVTVPRPSQKKILILNSAFKEHKYDLRSIRRKPFRLSSKVLQITFMHSAFLPLQKPI